MDISAGSCEGPRLTSIPSQKIFLEKWLREPPTLPWRAWPQAAHRVHALLSELSILFQGSAACLARFFQQAACHIRGCIGLYWGYVRAILGFYRCYIKGLHWVLYRDYIIVSNVEPSQLTCASIWSVPWLSGIHSGIFAQTPKPLTASETHAGQSTSLSHRIPPLPQFCSPTWFL